ncbi:EAL domain-containing protein [Mitsuokella sp. WILCCON 0060]|uniref:putative bifunctional diguanylate cyclase/phosphodiesterase n=1 Tax=Mitsuokella sp. WILCCON 0060 TaxID=3345341 RepID=UPI003F1C5BBF
MKIHIHIGPKKVIVRNSLLTALIAALVIGGFNFYLVSIRKANVSYRITSVANYQLKSVFDRYISITDDWMTLVMADNGEIDPKKYDRISEKLLAQYNDPAIAFIELAPQGVIRYLYPLQGAESLLNRDLYIKYKADVDYTKEVGQPTIYGPYEMSIGIRACVISKPIYLYDEQGTKKFWGYANIILRYPEVLNVIDMDAESRLYDYKLSHESNVTGKQEVILESSSQALFQPVSADFAFANGRWRLSAEWKGGWITRNELLMELLLMLLLAGLAGFYTNAYYKQRGDEIALHHVINDSDEALSVVAKDSSEVFMCNKAFRRLLGISGAFRSGLSYQEFFKHPAISLPELLENRSTVITNQAANNKLVIRAAKIDWNGTPAALLRGREYDLEFFDSLTLLPNQFHFQKLADKVIEKLQKSGRQPICVFYNIVGMKFFNAENGYAAGDMLLKETAKVLQDVYDDALVARFSNDNFCLLTRADGLQEKLKAANRRISLLGRAARIDVKAGIYGIRKDSNRSIAEITDAAKMAADSIHDDVDRHIRYYDDELRQQLLDQRFIREHLDKALQEKEFEVYYQPVIRALTGELAGYEALVRWHSKELGFLPPFRFIPILEQSHQITAVDTYVIREICRQYREDVDAGRPVVPISFNLSRIDIMQADMCEIITEAAANYQVPHAMLHIEITESILTGNEEKMHKEIKRFHDAGLQVWMDDFGSGYSNLNSLKDFDFDVIKLDMKFLSSMSEKAKSILYSTVAMAKQIGIETLAEGCETQEHYDFLRAIGCEKIQGWYFGKPLPLAEARKNLAAKEITTECSEDAAFYHAAGQLLYPLKDPFAILEEKKGQCRFLYWNKAYEQLTFATTQLSMAALEQLLSRTDSPQRKFLERQLQKLSVGESQKFAYPYKGNFIILTTKLLNRQEKHLLLWLSQENSRANI